MDFGKIIKESWDQVSKQLVPWAIFFLVAMVLSFTLILIPTVARGICRASLDFVRAGKEPELSELWNFEDYLQYLLLCLVMAVALTVAYSLLVIPGVALNTLWLYGAFYMADKRHDFWPGLTASKDAVLQSGFWNHLLIFIIVNVLNYAGGAVCGLGLLITGPLSIVIMAHAYLGLPREN